MTQDAFLYDLNLMHIYTLSTSISIDSRPELQQTWQVAIAQEAMSQPYLMHSLLAMAALHQIAVGTDCFQRYLSLALKHHCFALAKSRPELDFVTERNCHGLFALSAMIAVSSLALPICRSAGTLEDPIGEFAQSANLVRGSKTIVQSSRDCLSVGRFGKLLHYASLRKQTALPKHIEGALGDIEQRLTESSDIRKEDMDACRSALEGLRTCFRNIHISQTSSPYVVPENIEIIFAWLATIDTEFISLLLSRYPLALVILAYFAIFLHLLNKVWWCRGWGLALMDSIQNSLDETWKPVLQWPMHQFAFIASQQATGEDREAHSS
ncbi:MAG: hypothetical protein Q9217_002965 [Psora testacea]